MTLPDHLVESLQSMLSADAIKIGEKIDANRQILESYEAGTRYRFYISSTRSLYLEGGRLWHEPGKSRRVISDRNGHVFPKVRSSALMDLCLGLVQDLKSTRPTEILPILDRWRLIPTWIDLLATGSAPTLYPEWTVDDWQAIEAIEADMVARRLE